MDDALLLSPDDTDLLLDDDHLNWDLLDYEDDKEEGTRNIGNVEEDSPGKVFEASPTSDGSKLIFTKSSASHTNPTSSELGGLAKKQILDLKKINRMSSGFCGTESQQKATYYQHQKYGNFKRRPINKKVSNANVNSVGKVQNRFQDLKSCSYNVAWKDYKNTLKSTTNKIRAQTNQELIAKRRVRFSQPDEEVSLPLPKKSRNSNFSLPRNQNHSPAKRLAFFSGNSSASGSPMSSSTFSGSDGPTSPPGGRPSLSGIIPSDSPKVHASSKAQSVSSTSISSTIINFKDASLQTLQRLKDEKQKKLQQELAEMKQLEDMFASKKREELQKQEVDNSLSQYSLIMTSLMKQNMQMMKQMEEQSSIMQEDLRKFEERKKMDEIESSLTSMQQTLLGKPTIFPSPKLPFSNYLNSNFERRNPVNMTSSKLVSKVPNRFKDLNLAFYQNSFHGNQTLPDDLVLTDITDDGPRPARKIAKF